MVDARRHPIRGSSPQVGRHTETKEKNEGSTPSCSTNFAMEFIKALIIPLLY